MLRLTLPYCRAVLENYLAVIYLLFVSSLVDLFSLLFRVGTPLTGAYAAGTLLATILPITGVWVRYAGGFGREFAAWEKVFVEATPKPPAI